MRDRRCLPCGQKRFRVARLILELSRERTGSCSALPIRNGWQARRENGKRTAIHADHVSKMSKAASPCAWACRRLRAAAPSGTNRSLSAPCLWGRQASTSSQRRCQPALPARRALPAPAQGINPLRIPFRNRPSPTPQAAGPCSWACRRLLASPPQPERNAARPPPIRGAGVRQHGAEGAGFRYYRMAAFSAARPET